MTNLFDETSAISRNIFRYLLESEEKRALRYGYFFSLLSVSFDQIEDGKWIKNLVRLIRHSIRDSDLIGKINHSGLLIMLSQAEGTQAMQIGERIRIQVEHSNFVLTEEKKKRTISIGCACFPTHYANIDDLIFLAHEMLLIAKSRGGNKVLLPGGVNPK